MERICTDVAFLDNGVVSLQGKLADMKAQFRSEEYCLEVEHPEDAGVLLQTFAHLRQTEENQLVFHENNHSVNQVLHFLADRSIPILKLERVEPTLESLFMEVTGK